MKKDLHVFILTVIIMAMMPLSAFSTEKYSSDFAELKAEIENAEPNSSITIGLLGDIDFTDVEDGNRTINIDKGKNITIIKYGSTFICDADEYLFRISEGSELTIQENGYREISCPKFAEVIDGSTLTLDATLINCTGKDWIVAKKVNGESGGTIKIINHSSSKDMTIKHNNTFCNLNDGSTLYIMCACEFEPQAVSNYDLITLDDKNLSRILIDYGHYIYFEDGIEPTEDEIIDVINDRGRIETLKIIKDEYVWEACEKHELRYKGVKPTCISTGIEDHYYCIECNRYYEDEEATKPFYRYHVAKELPYGPHNYDEMTDRCTKCYELMECKNIVDGEECNHKYRNDYETFKKFTYRRTFTEKQVGKWQALYIPFKLEYNDWRDGYDVAAINNFHEYFDENGNAVKRELEICIINNGRLYPNIPYLIRPKAAGEMVLEKENANVYPAYEMVPTVKA